MVVFCEERKVEKMKEELERTAGGAEVMVLDVDGGGGTVREVES